MRLFLGLSLFAATGFACIALASPTAAPDPASPVVQATQAGLEPAPAATVNIVGTPRPYVMPPGRFADTIGAYALDNGVMLRVSGSHGRLYAQIGQVESELIPVADHVFFARSEDLTLVTGLGSTGEEMYITYRPETSALVPREAMERIAALR